jgi:hypothetical protein
VLRQKTEEYGCIRRRKWVKNEVCVNNPYTTEVKENIRRVIYNCIYQRVEYFDVC